MGDPTLCTSQVFVVPVSRKVSLIEDSECGCLSHHVTIVESLGPPLWVVMFGIIYFVEIYNPNFDNIFNDIF